MLYPSQHEYHKNIKFGLNRLVVHKENEELYFYGKLGEFIGFGPARKLTFNPSSDISNFAYCLVVDKRLLSGTRIGNGNNSCLVKLWIPHVVLGWVQLFNKPGTFELVKV